MQMKELQDALRATWLQIQGNAVDDKSAAGRDEPCSLNETGDACRTDLKTFKDAPSSPTTYYLQRLETPITQPLVKEKVQESKINSVTFDPPTGNGEKSINKQYQNGYTRTDLVSLNDLKTFKLFKNVDKCNASDERKVSFTQQDSMRPIADKSELHGISGVDEHNSSDFLNIRPRVSEEQVLSTSTERKRCSSSHLSPQPYCEAVPVIRHSSRAAVLQESEVSAGPPPLNPASEASVQLHSKTTNFSPSVSTDNDNTTEAITTESKDQNQDPRSTARHTECVIVCKENKNSNSNDVRLFKFSDKNCKTSSYNTNSTNQNAHGNSSQSNTEFHGEYLVQNNDSKRGLKHQMDSDFDPVPSKKQHLDCFECQRISLSTVRQSQDEGAAVSLPMEARGAGNDYHCEECLEVEVKRERSYCSRSFASEDIEENQGRTSGPLTDWYSNTYKDEKTGKDDISSKDEYNINSTQTKLTLMTSQSERVNATGSFSSSQCCKVLKREKSSCPERKELSCFLAAPVDNNLSGTTRNTGETHRWHLPYQGKPLEDASLQDSNQEPSEPKFSPDSDELDNEVNVGAFAFSGQRSLNQYLSVEIEDQSIINTKCNELHVSYQHDSDKDEKKQSVGMDTAEIKSPDNPQMIKGIFIARAESLDRTDGQTEKEDGNAFDTKQCRTGVWVTANTGVMEVSKPNENETKMSSSPVCSPLSEPDCDRASNLSTVAVCIPSSLPTSGPTDRSVHLTPPNPQPFQCSLCDRSFSQRGSLNRHVRSHLGVRPFQCPCCPMTFSRQYRVTEHMRVHQRCAHGDGLQKTHQSFVTNNEERPQN